MKSTRNTLSGLALAATAATLFMASPMGMAAESSSTDKGHCAGVNACKGKSSCKTASSACKGHNACKGQGFVVTDKATCEQLGGTFEKA